MDALCVDDVACQQFSLIGAYVSGKADFLPPLAERASGHGASHARQQSEASKQDDSCLPADADTDITPALAETPVLAIADPRPYPSACRPLC
jgi:hypothetical protein